MELASVGWGERFYRQPEQSMLLHTRRPIHRRPLGCAALNANLRISQRSLDVVKRNRGSAQTMNAASMQPPSIALCCIEATDLWN